MAGEGTQECAEGPEPRASRVRVTQRKCECECEIVSERKSERESIVTERHRAREIRDLAILAVGSGPAQQGLAAWR